MLSRRRLSLGPLERLAAVRTFETGPGASSPTIHEGRRQTALQRKSDRSRETRSRRIITDGLALTEKRPNSLPGTEQEIMLTS